MTDRKVIERLLAFAPPAIARVAHVRQRCILATAVGCDVLREFDVDARPLPVHVRIANKQWMDATSRGASDVGAIAVGGHIMVPADTTAGTWWNGHLVVQLPRQQLLLDLDAQQFSRPAHNIYMPAASTFDWPAGTDERIYQRNRVYLLIRATDDRRYETGRDWWDTARRAPLVAQVCRAIRAGRLHR